MFFTDKDRNLLERILWVLEEIDRKLPDPYVDKFIITQQGDPMALLPLAPGFSPVFTATPVPASSVPAPGAVLAWESSDNLNFPITPSGLTCTVNIPTTAVVGTTGTLSISYINPDGSTASGSISWTIVANPSADITSFVITQTQ